MTVSEFVSGGWKPRIRPPNTPHLAHLPAKRPTAGIRQQDQLLAIRQRIHSVLKDGFPLGLRALVRRHRRAQGDRSTLRSIRPKRAASLTLARTIARTAVAGIAEVDRDRSNHVIVIHGPARAWCRNSGVIQGSSHRCSRFATGRLYSPLLTARRRPMRGSAPSCSRGRPGVKRILRSVMSALHLRQATVNECLRAIAEPRGSECSRGP